MKELIIKLLKEGKTYKEIGDATKLKKNSISYYNTKYVNRSTKYNKKVDWKKIEHYYNDGHSRSECLTKFEVCEASWYKAIKCGRLSRGCLEKDRELCNRLVINSKESRGSLKKTLIRKGVLKNECCVCGQLPIWNDKKLVMVFDHINGVHNDYRLENIRLLCPNCNSQTDTFSGKNKKYKK